MRPIFFSTFSLFFLAIVLTHAVALHRGVLATRHPSSLGARAWARAPSKPTLGDDVEDVTLIDIVLVASIDGSFHAVNRTSGQRLWSMSATASDIPSSLAPLVRTKHAAIDYDLTDDDDAHQELYIIEPQTGDIYVMVTPTSPLQPLSVSMSQLVELSPFKFDREEDERVFVGKKETSLLSIELETGKVKTISPECPWNPFEDFADKGDIDLDELEDYSAKSDGPIFTEVFVGRTDYHVAIYNRSPSGRRLPIHNLSFSSYGPNMQDNAVQATYRRTPDNIYIESLPNGQIMSFKARDSASADPYMRRESQVLWALSFDSPIVAVFDVLSSSKRSEPFVLMQPRPPISDVLRGFDKSSSASVYDPDTAYVGLVEETGSLFVMGNDHYPLIAFGDTEYSINSRFIDPPPSAIPRTDLPDRVDTITKRRKLRELCAESPFDTRCLTGKRPLDASSLNSRQLPGVPSAELPPELEAAANNVIDSAETFSDISDTTNNLSTAEPSGTSVASVIGERFKSPATLGTVLLAMIFGSTWLFRNMSPINKLYRRIPHVAHEVQSTSNPSVTSQSAPMDVSPVSPLVPDGETHDMTTPSSSSTVDDETSPSTPISLSLPDSAAQLTDSPTISKVALDSPGAPIVDDIEESEREGEAADATPKKRKVHRRRRGRKGKGNNSLIAGAVDETEGEKDGEAATGSKEDGSGNAGEENMRHPGSATLVVQSTPQPSASSLTVSDTVLGFGSHGTVVFQGSLQGRAVAVKRLLRDFVTLASREVSILQESDDHPNVIRYYFQESQGNFLYIALELCPASLADVIESPDQHQEIVAAFDPKRALRQISSGLRHLHSLKIIHRDIKPHNILISTPKNGATGKDGGRRMLISDFGLCKKLEVDQTSFLPTAQGAQAAGTVGWRAPELLRGDVKLEDSLNDDGSQSSTDSASTIVSGGSSMPRSTARLTKAVDIFALGCLFYYVLTNGSHPFGGKFEREVNIIKNVKNLDGLEMFGEEGSEAVDLIGRMLNPEPSRRPDTTSCLVHPFFWDAARRLNFLQDSSDRFEIMCRDPRDHNLVVLETGAFDIVGHDWHARLDKVFIENLGKFRKYDGKSVQDLLRALRNKKHHYQDLPEHVKRTLGLMPEGFLSYFTKRFPQLFMHVHGVISATHLHTESMFRGYFEPNES